MVSYTLGLILALILTLYNSSWKIDTSKHKRKIIKSMQYIRCVFMLFLREAEVSLGVFIQTDIKLYSTTQLAI